MSVSTRLAGLLLVGACACSRPAQPEPRPPVQDAPTPEAGASPAPALAVSTNDAGEAPTAPTPDAGPASSSSAPDAGRALSIAELRRLTPASGTHVIEGVITRVVPCPPCPEGAMCKPCVGDHVIVSDGPEAPQSHSRLGGGDLIVFVPQAALMDRLAPGQRYRLTVRIRSMKTTAQPINDVELIDLSQ